MSETRGWLAGWLGFYFENEVRAGPVDRIGQDCHNTASSTGGTCNLEVGKAKSKKGRY